MGKRVRTSVDVPYLCGELLIQILCRLPTKSLFRFKCVSKLWEDLITTLLSNRRQSFMVTRYNHESDQICSHEHIFAPPSEAKHANYICKFLEEQKKIIVDHVCNGLVLYHQRVTRPVCYFVFNTATGESVALPVVKIANFCYLSCLAFDPLKSPHYKVVRYVEYMFHSGPRRLQIYSSMTGKWIEMISKTKGSSPKNSFAPAPVFHEGSLYWASRLTMGYVRFDVERCSYQVFNCTNLPAPKHQPTPKGVSRGRLYFASSWDFDGRIFIWILKEGQPNKLVLKHTIKRETFVKHPLTRDVMWQVRYRSFAVAAFDPDSEVIYVQFHSKIISYQPTTGVLQEVLNDKDFSPFYKAFTITVLV